MSQSTLPRREAHACTHSCALRVQGVWPSDSDFSYLAHFSDIPPIKMWVIDQVSKGIQDFPNNLFTFPLLEAFKWLLWKQLQEVSCHTAWASYTEVSFQTTSWQQVTHKQSQMLIIRNIWHRVHSVSGICTFDSIKVTKQKGSIKISLLLPHPSVGRFALHDLNLSTLRHQRIHSVADAK